MKFILKKFGFILILMTITVLAACGGLDEPGIADNSTEQGKADSTSTDAEATGETVILKLGHVFAEDDITHKSSVKLAELAKEYSDGELQIDIYPNSSLGEERDLIEGVQLGTVDIGLSSNAVATNFLPSLVYWDLPYIIDSTEHIEKIENSEVNELLNEEFEGHNFKNLGIQYGGFRQITNSVRPIESLEDFDGINLRVLESKVMIETFQNLPGLRTSNMAFSELYSGLQQGVVTAQENPINLIYSMKFFEVQDYISLTNHFYTTRYFLMNNDKFKDLSDKQQEALTRATDEAMDYHKEELFNSEKEILQNLKDEGMQVNEVSTDFVNEFRGIMEEKVYPKFYSEIGNGDEEAGKELVDKVIELR